MKILKFDIDLLNAFDRDFEKLVRSAKSKGFEGFEYEGNLNFNGAKITTIPDNCSVTGWIYLGYCRYLESIGDNLSVGDWLGGSNCKSLISIGNNISVGENLNLYRCTSLISIGNNIAVGGDLDLRYTGIKTLPKSVYVKGNILT